MRDGTRLAADIYLPRGVRRAPVLIERTPYNKQSSSEVAVKAPEYFASRGYAVVIQDVRGRFASEGEFIPFHDDGWGANRDGYDTVEWAAAEPWSSGKVGTIGGSYSGATQYRMAPTRPPHLVAQYVRESSSDYHEEWVYRGGAFELAFSLGWALNVTRSNLAQVASGADLERLRGVLDQGVKDVVQWQRHLPLADFPLIAGLSDWYRAWLRHPDDGPFWWQWNIAHRHAEIDAPICHLGGWFDIFLRGTLTNYAGIRRRGGPRAQGAQRLIVGPWVHGPGGIGSSRHGEVDFGRAAAQDFNGLRLRWFDFWLKGVDTGVMDEPPVRLFTMGVNRWRDEEAWPLPDTRYTPCYFRDGKSRSVRSLNDGRLSFDGPSEAESPDSFVYDPDRPVPTKGGNTLNVPGGAYDQQEVERLCLTYTSDPLRRDLDVTGPVTCVLYGMSSTPDTDWVARLSDVSPDGHSRNVCDGILRARYRESRQHPSLIAPNQVYRYEVDLWATSNVFRAGHRVRVTVTSSNFPRFDRNLNTGGPCNEEARGRAAVNTVFHDAVRPSHIVLPVVER